MNEEERKKKDCAHIKRTHARCAYGCQIPTSWILSLHIYIYMYNIAIPILIQILHIPYLIIIIAHPTKAE